MRLREMCRLADSACVLSRPDEFGLPLEAAFKAVADGIGQAGGVAVNAPFAVDGFDQFPDDGERLFRREIEMGRCLNGEIEVGFVCAAVDGKHLVAEVGELGHDVEGGRQPVALATSMKDAVVFQVVVGAVNQDVEEHAPEKLVEIAGRRGAEPPQFARESDVVGPAKVR